MTNKSMTVGKKKSHFFLGEYIVLLTQIYHGTFFKYTQNYKHKVSPKVE